MKMLECEGDLGSVKAGSILGETDFLAKMEEELTTVEEIRDEIK